MQSISMSSRNASASSALVSQKVVIPCSSRNVWAVISAKNSLSSTIRRRMSSDIVTSLMGTDDSNRNRNRDGDGMHRYHYSDELVPHPNSLRNMCLFHL